MFRKRIYGILIFIVGIIFIGVIAVGFIACFDLFDDINNNNKEYGWYGNVSASTFTISNATQLEELAKIVRGTTGDNGPAQSYFKGKTVILSADIDMSGKSWYGITTSYGLGDLVGFNGTFDGNNKTISGLQANNQGFFGLIGKDGIVKNIVFVDLKVDGDDGGGGLARVNYGKIQNIIINGTVSGNPGGVVCFNYGIVENCSFSGNITGGSGGGIAVNNFAGGVIRKCYVTGNISGGCGGIVNSNYGTVQNCYVICNVTGFNSTGGVVGYNKGIIQNCYATGNITSDMSNAGGITGSNRGTVRNCVALNPSINAEMYIGRIGVNADSSSISINNYGLIEMEMKGRWVYTINPNVNGQDGANVSSVDAATQDWWITNVNWDFDTIWQWDDSKNLPILR